MDKFQEVGRLATRAIIYNRWAIGYETRFSVCLSFAAWNLVIICILVLGFCCLFVFWCLEYVILCLNHLILWFGQTLAFAAKTAARSIQPLAVLENMAAGKAPCRRHCKAAPLGSDRAAHM